MKYTIDKQENYILLRLHEDTLDSNVAPKLKTEIVTMHAEGCSYMVLDLGEVKYTDSSGLSALLVGNRLLQEDGGFFALTGLSEHTRKLLRISQLESVMNIYPTVSEGIEAIFIHQIENDLKAGN